MTRAILLFVLVVAAPAWAAPISVDIDKNVNLQLGSKSFGPFALPDDVGACTFIIDRANWTNPAATLTVSLEISVNNGPFAFWLGMGSLGGEVDPTVPNATVTRALPTGVTRRIQGAYVVSGARFRSTVSVACQ